jgi:hypothetical protein
LKRNLLKTEPYKMKTSSFIIAVIVSLNTLICHSQNPSDGQIILRDNWAIQSSEKIGSAGDAISMPGYKTNGWYPTTVPATVLAALVANKVYPDPYYGTTSAWHGGIVLNSASLQALRAGIPG